MNAFIKEFLTSWQFFGNSYLSGWLIAVALAQLGCLVVARNQAFLGAAVAQASAGSVAIALWASTAFAIPWLASHEGDPGHAANTAAAIIGGTLASIAGLARGRSGDSSTAWLFLMGGCMPMLLLATHPHDLEQVSHLFASSLIGASRIDVEMFAALAVVIAVGFAVFRRRICLVVLDPTFASAVGIRVNWWSAGLALSLGVALGLAIASAGTLFTFGCLVLPALIARSWCRTLAGMFIAAPAIALMVTILAFVWANHRDHPPGQMAVAFLGAVLVLGTGARRLLTMVMRVAKKHS